MLTHILRHIFQMRTYRWLLLLLSLLGVTFGVFLRHFHINLHQTRACLSGAVGSVAVRAACMAAVIGESGFEAQASRIIVSGYSGVCFEIKFSGRPLANTGFRDAQY